MPSVVIAAHNEGRILGQCLDALLSGAHPEEFDVVVVANGCQDDTIAEASKRSGVRVLDLPTAGKAAALNVGDGVARGFPRVFLDADMAVTAAEIRRVCAALLEGRGQTLMAFPRRQVDSSAATLPVRAYFAINGRLPVFREAAFGRGMIVLSEAGRRRFAHFPDVVADDLFVDGLFLACEKRLVDSVSVRVTSPRTTRELVSRLVRVRRGNAALRAAAARGDLATKVERARRASWFFDVVLRKPWLAPAGAVYLTVTVWAALRARSGPLDNQAWGRLEPSRGDPAGRERAR